MRILILIFLFCNLNFIFSYKTFKNGIYQEIIEEKNIYVEPKTNTQITLPLYNVLIFDETYFVYWNISTSAKTDFYIVNEENLKKLQFQILFSSYWSLENATLVTGQIDTSNMNEILYLCVVNRNPFSIYVDLYVFKKLTFFNLIFDLFLKGLFVLFCFGVSILLLFLFLKCCENIKNNTNGDLNNEFTILPTDRSNSQ